MSKTERIAVLDNGMEASRIEAALTERNIPHAIRTFEDSAYNGLYKAQKGWGTLEAPEEYKVEILQIVEDLRTE